MNYDDTGTEDSALNSAINMGPVPAEVLEYVEGYFPQSNQHLANHKQTSNETLDAQDAGAPELAVAEGLESESFEQISDANIVADGIKPGSGESLSDQLASIDSGPPTMGLYEEIGPS